MNVEVGRNVFELLGGLVSVGANKNRKPSNVTGFQSQEVGGAYVFISQVDVPNVCSMM